MKINMNLAPGCLPYIPDNAACSAWIADTPLTAWMPALAQLQRRHGLADGAWSKIATGSNALFSLGDGIIVKLVPPNWRRQGDKEILVTPMLEDRLSLRTPQLIGCGEIDGWVYVITSRLQGTLLADIWPALNPADKHAIMLQAGQVLRELRAVPFAGDSAIRADWPTYTEQLITSCVARHQRRNMPAGLLGQVLPYLESAGDFLAPAQARFIHMDVHPWNLMARQAGGRWRLDGLFDYGDAIIGNSGLLELLTPMIFMAQGDAALLHALLDGYGMRGAVSAATLRHQLAATMLVRPDSDVTFCMRQVPVSGPRDTWQQVAAQMFPLAD